MAVMTLEIQVLIPCHSLEDFPTEQTDQPAASLLNSFAVAYHPELLACLSEIPRWRRADDPPLARQDQVIFIPLVSNDWLPHGWADEARRAGAIVISGISDRQEMVARPSQLRRESRDHEPTARRGRKARRSGVAADNLHASERARRYTHQMRLAPQQGPQEAFLASSADIVIYGGAAGGGKSYALLLEPLRHVLHNPAFNAVFFRRSTVQIRNPGGLWDESVKLYIELPGASAVQNVLEWKFDSGGKIKFAHLEHETTVYDWQGSQIPLLCFDELTHFSASQFWYMLSRNRSVSGVRPYVRATCNPDADSWVADLIAWWIDQDTGLAISERSGVVRWFVRINDAIIWADDPGELTAEFPESVPKSLTFIRAVLDDNQALVKADPGYRANLMAQTYVERERLLGGNWKVRPAAGLYFQRAWCKVVDAPPARLTLCRGWDLAATPDTGSNDPDWTSGTLLGVSADRSFYVLDNQWLRGTPGQVRALIRNIANDDGRRVSISIPQDPAQAGKDQAENYIKMLSGWNVHTSPEGRNLGGQEGLTPTRQSAKITRFSPFSAQAEAGNVYVVRGAWNRRWFEELEAFPGAKHDDSADSTSRAFAFVALGARPLIVSDDVMAALGHR